MRGIRAELGMSQGNEVATGKRMLELGKEKTGMTKEKRGLTEACFF